MKKVQVTISYTNDEYKRILQEILEKIVSSNAFTQDMVNYYINSTFYDNNNYEINENFMCEIRQDLRFMLEDITNML